MSRRAAVNVAIGAVYVAILVAVFLSIRPFARWYETTPPAEANAIVIMAFAAGIVMLIAVAMVLWARHKWLFARDEDTDEYLRPLRHGSVAAERQMLAFFRPRGWVHKPQTAARQMMARLDAARPRRRLRRLLRRAPPGSKVALTVALAAGWPCRRGLGGCGMTSTGCGCRPGPSRSRAGTRLPGWPDLG